MLGTSVSYPGSSITDRLKSKFSVGQNFAGDRAGFLPSAEFTQFDKEMIDPVAGAGIEIGKDGGANLPHALPRKFPCRIISLLHGDGSWIGQTILLQHRPTGRAGVVSFLEPARGEPSHEKESGIICVMSVPHR